MKVLRLFYSLTVLSVFWAALPDLQAQQQEASSSAGLISVRPHDCQRVREAMLTEIQNDLDRLNEILKQSILKSKHCTCELLTAAIQLSPDDEKLVKAIVLTALKNAEEMSSAIAECAVIAAPTQLAAIREAFAEVNTMGPPESKPVVPKEKAPSPSKGKIGTMIKKLVPGWEAERKEEKAVLVLDATKPVSELVIKNTASSISDLGEGVDDEGSSPAPAQVFSPGKDVRAGGVPEVLVTDERPQWQSAIFIGADHGVAFDFLWPELAGFATVESEGNHSPQWFTYADNGYDSNANTAAGDATLDSYFVGGGVGTYYSRFTQNSRFELKGRFGVRYDQGAASDLEGLVYRGQISARLEHQLSEKVQVSEHLGVFYDVEPDFFSGETSGFRTDQYIFAYNRLAFGYRWSKYFSTDTYYTLSTIQYEDDWLKVQEDRWRHLFGQQFCFSYNDRQTLLLEYRYGQSNFQSVANDSRSHYFLTGVGFEGGGGIKGTLLAGAERRSFERFSDLWRPYAEASFQAQLSVHTRLRWGARLGFEDAELGEFRGRYSFRTGLSIDQDLNDRLKASLGFFYLHSDFDTGGQAIEVYTDDALILRLGLTYALSENLDLYLSYYFTSYDSGDDNRTYDRNRVKLGLNSRF